MRAGVEIVFFYLRNNVSKKSLANAILPKMLCMCNMLHSNVVFETSDESRIKLDGSGGRVRDWLIL